MDREKANVVRRFDRSPLEVFEHYNVGSNPGVHDGFGLARAEYAPRRGRAYAGPRVPCRCARRLWPEAGGDHELALSALRRLAS